MNMNLIKSIWIVVFLFVSITAISQNLIKNPGFESDKTNWNNFWSKEGSGTATIVLSPVHSGNKAIRINYPGTQDWSFTSSDRLPVVPGTAYEMSCWTLISELSSEANFSVILYDAGFNVVNWTFGRVKMDKKSSSFTKFSTTFIVPEGIKYIQPRFEGWGNCTLYADDVFLTPYNSGGITGDFTVENDQIKAVIKLPVFSINITNKISSKNYQTNWAQFAIAKSAVQTGPESLNIIAEMPDSSKSTVSIDFKVEGKALKMNISGDSSIVLNSDIQFPGTIASQPNDYMIIPRGTGIMVPVNSNSPFGDFTTYSWKSTVPFVGITNQKDGYMVVTDDQWDASFQFLKPASQNNYSFQLHQKPSKNQLGYNRTVYLVLVDNGYVEMCNWYRSHAEKLGYVKTLEQKKAENPNIDKLIGAVDFWPLSMNMKSSFLDSVKLMGMDKAMWNLTGGWGLRDFSVLIDSINSKGFLSNRYDIFTDVWPPTHPEWSGYRTEGYPEDVIVDSNGELKKGWLAYPNNQPFQGFYTCAATHYNYAKKHVPEDLKTNRYNSRFIDVELSSSLEECYSEVHPVTRKQDAASRNSALGYIKNDLKLVTGSEEAHDFAFANVDYSEGTMTIVPAKNAGYDWSEPLEPTDKSYADQNISPAFRIPLHGLIYHDVHIPTWYTGDGVSKVPAYWDDKNLWNILYGTMPLYMPPSKNYWKTNLEKFISGYHYMTTVSRNAGYSKMTNHQFLTSDHNIQETTFENGWKVVVNFDSIQHDWNSKTLAAKGFYASDENDSEAGILMVNNKKTGWTITENRMFFNPYGNETAMKGFRTTGPVYIEKFTDYMLVSFIGKQNTLDLKMEDIPFGIKEITKVTEYFTGNTITLSSVADGWKRLTRPAGKTYFKIYFTSEPTGSFNLKSDTNFKVFPNPSNDTITINMKGFEGQQIMQIFNSNGKLMDEFEFSETAQINISKLSTGMYFIQPKSFPQLAQKIIKQ